MSASARGQAATALIIRFARVFITMKCPEIGKRFG
jgi:hypothetical protein